MDEQLRIYRILYSILYNHGNDGRQGPNLIYSKAKTADEARVNLLPRLELVMEYAREIKYGRNSAQPVHAKIISVTELPPIEKMFLFFLQHQ